jgi:hypothetical protein
MAIVLIQKRVKNTSKKNCKNKLEATDDGQIFISDSDGSDGIGIGADAMNYDLDSDDSEVIFVLINNFTDYRCNI